MLCMTGAPCCSWRNRAAPPDQGRAAPWRLRRRPPPDGSAETGCTRRQHWHSVETRQQVAQCTSTIGVEPSPASMLGRIVDHVAALAQRRQVARPVVAGIMVEMRARDIDAGRPDDRDQIRLARVRPPPLSIAPMPAIAIPPASVAEMHHPTTVRAPTMFAPTLGTAEADYLRQLGPIDRIEPTMFRHDRHSADSESVIVGTKGESWRE
jgi:hypothetical protein